MMSSVQASLPINLSIPGNSGIPPLYGGYIIINLDGVELNLVSVPSMIWGANRNKDNVVENAEQFADKNGNEFNVIVQSSNIGVDWEIDVNTEDETLLDRISVEYHANEY